MRSTASNQPSGLLLSPRVPPARNVYRGCCIVQPVRGIEETRPPAGGKKEPSGLFFSVWVPTARNVYRGSCRFDPYGDRTGRRCAAPQAISPVGCCLARGFHRLGMSTVVAAAFLYAPPRENAFGAARRPRQTRIIINPFPLKMVRAKRRPFQIVLRTRGRCTKCCATAS